MQINKFYNLNIKHPSNKWVDKGSTARYWLERQKKAPVFYGDTTIKEITIPDAQALSHFQKIGLANRALNEARLFLTLFSETKSDCLSYVITLDQGVLWIYSIVGSPHEHDDHDFNGTQLDIPKCYFINPATPISPVTSSWGLPISEVPLILASMRVNQAFSRGTFTEIRPDRYAGNIAAIKSVLGHEIGVINALDCLSSIEFETLVAKIFEEHGCFVPAYKGGFLQNIDLFVYPQNARTAIGSFIVAADEGSYSVQVKLRLDNCDRNLLDWLNTSKKNLLIVAQDSIQEQDFYEKFQDQIFCRSWLRDALNGASNTNNWLRRSLSWLGDAYTL